MGYVSRNCQGKCRKGSYISASTFSRLNKNQALFTFKVQIDDRSIFAVYRQHRCMQIIGERVGVCVTTTDRKISACCRIGVIMLQLQTCNLVKLNVLEAREKPIGFDLPIEMNTVKELGGVRSTSSGAMKFWSRTSSM